MSPAVRVTSEIGRLRDVICHTPGPELTVVTPDNRESYLFDDLLDLDRARREHERFVAVLRRFAEVHQVGDLLREVLSTEAARRELLEASTPAFRQRAEHAAPDELVRLFIEGEESRGGRLAQIVQQSGYSLPPLPNLLFTRDSAAVIDDRVLIAAMYHEVRWTEELIMRVLFSHHPLLENAGMLYDGTRESRMNTSLEGGDLHVLRPDLLLVGLSERTSAAGLDALAERLFASTEVRDLVVVILPRHRSSIHLDMIFTMVDRELCCVFPPYFLGPTRLPVLHVRADEEGVREAPDLFQALDAAGLPLTPLRCGGEKRTLQEREQWGSGCNFFAVAPGRLLSYDRNEHTLRELEREAGFRIVPADEFQAGTDGPTGEGEEEGAGGKEDREEAEEGRTVVTFHGSELVRGGGGPRCLTLPIRREPLT